MMTKTLEETLDYVATLVPLPAARRKKYTYMYETAKMVENGCIVELGTHFAPGSITLAYGAQAGHGAHVYTVDFYQDNLGDEFVSYHASDESIAKENIKNAGVEDIVTMVKGDLFEVPKTWDKEIGFLFWDLAMKRGLLEKGMNLWIPHVIHDGMIIVRDFPDGHRGADTLLEDSGHTIKFVTNDQGFWCYRKA